MELEIKDFILPLKKWWWLIVTATLVAAVSSYLAASQQATVYRSSASIIVGNEYFERTPDASQIGLSRELADFYVGLTSRGTFRTATLEALRERCNCELTVLPEFFVTRFNDSNAIDIIVEDTNPALTQAVAAEIANQLIKRSPTAPENDSDRQRFLDDRLDGLQSGIEQTESELAEKRSELGELVSAREIARTQDDIASLERTIQSLETSYASLLQGTDEGATNALSIIEPASPPWIVPDNKLIKVIAAAGIGFVLAASAAYLLEYLDDSVRTPEQVNRLTGTSTLAGVAVIGDNEDKLITIAKPRSPISEAFRVLRTAIQFSSVDAVQQSLLVTSSVPNEGKSTIAANLAVVMAQAGRKVLLIDADLRRPSQHKVFDLPNRRGLTSLLLDYSQAQSENDLATLVEDVVQLTPVAGLYLLTGGFIPPNPSELLGSVKMKSLIDELTEHFDFLIIDSAPILAVTDSAILSTQVDSTILVARAGKSRRGHLRQGMDRLREVGASVAGCVLNALPLRSDGYNLYYYYHEPYYGDEKAKEQKVYRPLNSRFRKKQEAAKARPKQPQEEFQDILPG